MISNREEERLGEELDPAGGGGDPVGGAVVQQEGVGRQVARIAVNGRICIIKSSLLFKGKCYLP